MQKPTLLVVDPGKNDVGVAFFRGGVLMDAAYLVVPKGTTAPDPVLADMIFRWLPRDTKTLDLLVTEDQQVYGRRLSDPNDLLPLARVVGAVRCKFTATAAEMRMVLPRDWTGGVPKEIRQEKFLRRLSACPEELEVLKNAKCPRAKFHNVVDAVHLGFWVLKRVLIEPPAGFTQ